MKKELPTPKELEDAQMKRAIEQSLETVKTEADNAEEAAKNTDPSQKKKETAPKEPKIRQKDMEKMIFDKVTELRGKYAA